jgi:hypothetical protein
MNPEAQRAFAAAATNVVNAYKRAGGFPGQEVTPPLLGEALEQCLNVFAEPESANRLSAGELNELGTHALNCVSDLALWAAHLKLDADRAAIEDLGLKIAEWLIAHRVPIGVLEPVVNALSRRANAIHEPERLVPIARLARQLVGGVADGTRADPASANPWRIFNFNYAIIATRTQRPELMEEAYDWLEANLPTECPAFFEEGVREARKAVYGPHVGEAMRQRLAKWTVRH